VRVRRWVRVGVVDVAIVAILYERRARSDRVSA